MGQIIYLSNIQHQYAICNAPAKRGYYDKPL